MEVLTPVFHESPVLHGPGALPVDAPVPHGGWRDTEQLRRRNNSDYHLLRIRGSRRALVLLECGTYLLSDDAADDLLDTAHGSDRVRTLYDALRAAR